MTRNAPSMPDSTPPVVITLPSSTYRVARCQRTCG
jgi:hypothetical protein